MKSSTLIIVLYNTYFCFSVQCQLYSREDYLKKNKFIIVIIKIKYIDPPTVIIKRAVVLRLPVFAKPDVSCITFGGEGSEVFVKTLHRFRLELHRDDAVSYPRTGQFDLLAPSI